MHRISTLRFITTPLLCAAAAATAIASDRADARNDCSTDGRARIVIAGVVIEPEVAADRAKARRGLMFRQSLAKDDGMLFVYATEQPRRFWTKNTRISLDIAFFDRDRRIFDIQPLEPMSTEMVISKAPAMYALEMNRGWFAANGVRVGDRMDWVDCRPLGRADVAQPVGLRGRRV